MPEKTIVSNANKNQSIECDEWLGYMNDHNLIPEKTLNVINENFEDHLYFKKESHTFHVDAMDATNKIVKEYNGVMYMVARNAILKGKKRTTKRWLDRR